MWAFCSDSWAGESRGRRVAERESVISSGDADVHRAARGRYSGALEDSPLSSPDTEPLITRTKALLVRLKTCAPSEHRAPGDGSPIDRIPRRCRSPWPARTRREIRPHAPPSVRTCSRKTPCALADARTESRRDAVADAAN